MSLITRLMLLIRGKQCLALRREKKSSGGSMFYCQRREGHFGKHRMYDGTTWDE